jgi:dienelactone hydrolase
VTATLDVAYETPGTAGLTKKLDVYAPVGSGSWPVVVMLHGGEVWKGFIAEWARAVSADGFVVFAPDWLEHAPGLTPRETFVADNRHARCAIAFAREHAAEYGGDPETLVVFGHSGGANVGGTAAFNPPPVSDGCLASDGPTNLAGLVTFEGDWLSMNPVQDDVIAADPAVLDAVTPWKHLSAIPDLPVIVLVSEGSGGVVEVPALDPPVDWRTARDPLVLRERFLAAGIRADVAQQQAILAAALEAQGHPVTFRELPNSGHSTLGEAGLEVLREAIREAAGG